MWKGISQIKINNQFIVKYRNMSQVVKASFWYTVCNFMLRGISIITVPLFTRILTEQEYGIVNVYNSWREIFLVLGTLNLFYGVYNNAMLKYEEAINTFTSSMIILIHMILAFWGALYVIFMDFWSSILELPKVLVCVMFVDVLYVSAINFWMAKQRFFFKYRKVVAVTIIMAVLTPILAILAIYCFENKAIAKIVASAIPNICIGFVLCIYFLKKGKKLIVKEYWKYALKFNIPLIPHYLSGTILNQSDRIIIGIMVAQEKAGIYGVAYSAAFLLTLVSTAINNTLVPWTYKKLKEENFKDIRQRANQLILFFAIVVLLFNMVVPEVIKILAPPSYYEAITILPVLVVSVFFFFLYSFFGTIEFYFEKTIFIMIASVIAAILNIALNILLIPIMGYFAAAYTTLICYIIMTITHYIFMKIILHKKKIKEKIYDLKTIIWIAVAVLVIGLLEAVLYDYILIRILLVLASGIIAGLKRDKIIHFLKKNYESCDDRIKK